MPPLKVLFVSSEVTPFCKTGGLADVAGALPKALSRRGIDMRVVTPLYLGVDERELERLDGVLSVPMYYGMGRAGVRMGSLPASDVPIYFIEHHSYFSRPHPYGPNGDAYPDNLERFTFFSGAALALSKALGFEPDVVHTNDWQTALIPAYLAISHGSFGGRAASLHTIHNLAYQGSFDGGGFFITGLPSAHFRSEEFEHFGEINLQKGGIQHSTLVSTVSPNYAREIRQPEHGFGLDGVLNGRGADLRGILNGIDEREWDPATDPRIAAPYDARDLSGKAACKRALQEELGLPLRDDLPVFGVIGRHTSQKGFDLLAWALDGILDWQLQVVLLGSGEPASERFFAEVSTRRGDKFCARTGFDEVLAHRIEAGSDFLIMPSRFEPCGLNQLYSMRYGTLPIVRATGGLVDTVISYDEATAEGTGFVFHDLNVESLRNTVGWALSTYYDRPAHILAMRRHAMRQDWSWDRAAAAYESLYDEARDRTRSR
jgi:starch synthase